MKLNETFYFLVDLYELYLKHELHIKYNRYDNSLGINVICDEKDTYGCLHRLIDDNSHLLSSMWPEDDNRPKWYKMKEIIKEEIQKEIDKRLKND